MSSILERVLIYIGAVLGLVALVFIIYTQHQLKSQQTAIQTQIVQQQQLVDGIVRSQSQWASKDDLANFAKQNALNLKAIQDNLSQLGAQLTSINVISADSNGQVATNVPSTGTGASNPNPTVPAICKDGTPCPDTDTYGYQKKEQDLSLNEDFGTLKVPFGKVGFSAWQQAPWNLNISPREYNVATVVGVDDNQRQYFYNKFTVNVEGQDYDVPIKNATTKQQHPSAVLSWWNPRFFVTAGGGINASQLPLNGSFNVGGTIGIMSYGRYKNNPDVSVLQLGAGYQSNKNEFSLIVNPVNFNFGKLIPGGLFNNVYIGPSAQFTFSGAVYLGANLSIGL